jgi:hypothetical protein
LVDLNTSRRFTRLIEGTLQVHNLGNKYTNDHDGGYASLGRQTKVGLRIRTP